MTEVLETPVRTLRTGRLRGLPTALLAAFIALAVIGLASAASWRATGGRWAIIETPSMGRAITVGSLVLVRPAHLGRLRVGDVVTYRPPGVDALYTHRVVSVQPDGRLRVQGDLNGSPDPFPVSQDMLVGQVVDHWRGLGWLLRALPTVLLALVVLAAVTHLYVPLRWRSSMRVVGSCLVLGATALLLRPFVHPVLITTTRGADGAATDTLQATVVSTGLLPTRVTGAYGRHVDLVSGQVASIPVLPGTRGGPMMINGSAHLTGWWLVGVAAVCLLPLLWTLVVGLAPDETGVEEPDATGDAEAAGA